MVINEEIFYFVAPMYPAPHAGNYVAGYWKRGLISDVTGAAMLFVNWAAVNAFNETRAWMVVTASAVVLTTINCRYCASSESKAKGIKEIRPYSKGIPEKKERKKACERGEVTLLCIKMQDISHAAAGTPFLPIYNKRI